MTTTLADDDTVTIPLILPPYTAPAAADIAAVLDLAADHLDSVGWIQGAPYDEEQAEKPTPLEECRVPVDGAIRAAVYSKPRCGRESTTEQIELVIAAWEALSAHLGGLKLAFWNDAPQRTAGDVKANLRAAAASLRGESA